MSSRVTYDSGYKVAVVVGCPHWYRSKDYSNLPTVKYDIFAIVEYLKANNFDITELYHEKATSKALNRWFEEKRNACSLFNDEQKKKKEENKKFVFFVFYAGHGLMVNTAHIVLPRGQPYPLE
jgi:hypothetical protein